MRIGVPATLVATLLSGLVTLAASPAFAAVGAQIKTQEPCTASAGSWCMSFGNTGTIPAVRSLSFKAPSKGTAKVTFHGALYCSNAANALGTISLFSGIVPGASSVVTDSQSGTLTPAFTLEPDRTSDAFNLASTRVFSFAANETKTFYFKFQRAFMSSNTTCWVYNAVLSVHFVPAAPAGGPLIKAQEACGVPYGSDRSICATILPVGTVPIARQFAFTAPSAGTAEVSFHGTMVCNNGSSSRVNVNLTSQIVIDKEVPNEIKPGGALHNVVLDPGNVTGRTDTFNLAATRIVKFTGKGAKTFYFKLKRNRMPSGSTCSVVLAAFTVYFLPDAAAHFASIQSQAPCSPKGEYCTFVERSGGIPVIQKMNFTAPAKGTAVVTFNGSMQCISQSLSRPVVDLASQIVTASADVASAAGPGGLRHAIVLEPQTITPASVPVDTFDLASTRVVSFSGAGKKTFYFKFARARMDAASCIVFNGAFTVNFVPK